MSESTTPHLVELVRRYLEAGNRRDFDAMMSFWAPDAVWYTGGPTLEGRVAIRSYFEDMASSFDDTHAELEEFIDFGNGVVFSVTIITGRPVGSSEEVRVRVAGVGVWTEGTIERVTDYADNFAEARAAAELLAEERAQADV